MRYLMACVAVSLLLLCGGADKPAPEWTTDLTKMKAPDDPVAGKLFGGDFKVDTVQYQNTMALILKQGNDKTIFIFLTLKPGQGLAGKSFEFGADKVQGEKRPSIHIHARTMVAVYTDSYAMKLEFGPEKDDKVVGKIYLCLPDDGKSFLAGTFTVEFGK